METLEVENKLAELHKNSGEDFLPINGTDYIEFYVGNAKQSAYYYQAAWGIIWLLIQVWKQATKKKPLMCFNKVKPE